MIDDLFYGNVNSYERPATDDPEIQAATKVLVDLEENLCKEVRSAQLDALSNAYATLNELSMLRAFQSGFRVGFGIAEDLYRQTAQSERAK
ncbi:hypothetical protein OBV_34580 [Oscillibacter valericigenes Sjm18-20]|nr:hypothetical protein OBV_34580 [Oscillibacter valericigenes Sjm18-20]